MSYELVFLHSSDELSPFVAEQMYTHTFNQNAVNEGEQQADGNIAHMVKELNVLAETERWATRFSAKRGMIAVYMPERMASEGWQKLAELADRYDLQLYDPQWNRVTLPSSMGGNWRQDWVAEDDRV